MRSIAKLKEMIMQRRVLVRMGVVALFLSGCLPLFGDVITISVSPSSQIAGLGSPLNVALQIAGLGDHSAPSLGTFDLNLTFDPNILAFGGVVFGDPVLEDQLDPTGFGNVFNLAFPAVGTVQLFDLSFASVSDLNSLQAPNFALARLTFDTIGVGTSGLVVTVNALGDADGNPLSVDLQNGTAEVSAVPEPGSDLLLATSMFVIAICRRRFHLQRR